MIPLLARSMSFLRNRLLSALPMSFGNIHFIHIDTVCEPPSFLTNLYIIPAHLPLPHLAILSERPVFQPIASFPLVAIVGILVLVPKLDSDLVVCEGKQLFTETVVLFLLPFLRQELFNGLSSTEEG